MSKILMNLFGRPSGWLGNIGGRIMAMTNQKLNQWTISLLNVQPNDNILEVGFGPGTAIQEISKRIEGGSIVGIDPSQTMLAQAQKRNASAIEKGKVRLLLSSVENLPAFDEPFDKIFSVNSIIFWQEPIECLKTLRRHLTPSGMIIITWQPRSRGATDETVTQGGQRIAEHLKEAGFAEIQLDVKKMKPVSAASVIGYNP